MNTPTPKCCSAVLRISGTAELLEAKSIRITTSDGLQITGRLSKRNLLKRITDAPEGVFHFKIFFRSNREAQLKPNGNLITDVKQAETHEPARFRVIGQAIQLDRAELTARIRVFPTQSRVEPFVINAKTTLRLMDPVMDARWVQMDGTLTADGRLETRSIQILKNITVDARWNDWKPKRKPTGGDQ